MQQFMQNLEKVKKISKEWDEKYRRRQQETLKKVDAQIMDMYENNREGVFGSLEPDELKKLEAMKESLLLQEEKSGG